MIDVEKLINDAQKNKDDEQQKYSAFARVAIETIPPFESDLTPEQKRGLIRKYVGKYMDTLPPVNFQIDQYKLYSIVCSILANEQGLNK